MPTYTILVLILHSYLMKNLASSAGLIRFISNCWSYLWDLSLYTFRDHHVYVTREHCRPCRL